MKVEPKMKTRDEEILKMEIHVLKKLQESKHVCRFVACGTFKDFTFVVMSLLGTELADVRRRCPKRQVSHPSVLRLAIQTINAMDEMHNIGFIHRDIKPTNLALGHKMKHVVFIFDFGLARQIMLPDKDGKLQLRDPRAKVAFRGTVRYCSINVHLMKEQGRHDDLWAVLHSMIELCTGKLPWKGQPRKEAEKIKLKVKEEQLVKGCPKSFSFLYKEISKLDYKSVPNYKAMKGAVAQDLLQYKIKMTDPWEWEGAKKEKKSKVKKKDEEREKDNDGDNTTTKEIDTSAATDVSNNDSVHEYDVENTLENIADIKHLTEEK